MIQTKKRMALCICLLTVNLAFIWGNSLLSGEISGALSQWIKNLIAALLGLTPQGEGGHGLLRKFAHFTEFCTLGMCFWWLFRMLLTRQFWPALGAGFLTACIDETIQIFVPDRGPGIKDVGIDTAGVLAGLVFIILINKRKQNLEDKS